jgi:deoxyribodipyrimidine photo-lyase
MPVTLLWFKRDLRLGDHAALHEASAHSRRHGHALVCLYLYEPSLLRSPEFDASHLVFINQCLEELRAGIGARGGRLTLRVGEAPGAFEALERELAARGLGPIAALVSHEETGNELTYRRDRRVARWCRQRRVIRLRVQRRARTAHVGGCAMGEAVG